ncbi:hypothetical protein [Mongoliitalea lutea]|uniref:Uncharacterized protein n=1 Tax=Mongoliitalea lutea TaxID=849756 RepID=A0A8J3CZ08_9BACT|nr:hypothetical protein [Mongoliitalea lutea]GHB44348.1 hypothetical protein GCM10008106_26750 [Mongoliitalea lutea]
MSIIKKEFVRRILQEESQRMEKNQLIQMRRLLNFHTNELVQGRELKVTQQDTMDGALSFRHKAYQRFLDLKKKPLIKRGQRIKRRNFPIHNRYVFGHYFSIANRLMVDFTNKVADGIKRDLEQK